jgi:hypothetical protein
MLVLQHFFSYLKLNETKNFNIRTAIFRPTLCTRNVWRPGSARTRWGSSQRSPRPPSCFKGAASRRGPLRGRRGREGKGKGKGREREEKERKGEGRRGEGREGGKGKGKGPTVLPLAPTLRALPWTPDNTPLPSSDTPTFEFLYKTLLRRQAYCTAETKAGDIRPIVIIGYIPGAIAIAANCVSKNCVNKYVIIVRS